MPATDFLRDKLRPLFERMRALPPGKRENLVKAVLIGGGMVVLVSAYYLLDKDEKQAPAAKEKVAVIRLGDSRLEDDIRAQVERERQEQRSQNTEQDKTIRAQQEQVESQAQQLAVMQSVLQAMQGGDLPLPTDATNADASKTPQDPLAWERAPTRSGATLAGDQSAGAAAAGAELAPQVTFIGDIGTVGAVKTALAPEESAKKNTRKFFLPTSFMPAKLLTGLKAKTVDSAKEDPEPILLRVQAPAVLPNEVRAQLEGCFVVAHGYGSLASERVEARLVSLSCLDFDGRSVIEQELTGIVVDQDGVKGLAGRPVTKMGANLARLFVAGLVQGAGQAFQQSAVTTSVSPLGQTQTLDTDKLATAGAGRGISSAGNELAKVYAELVRQAAPVIEIGPSKDVAVFVTQGVWLEVNEYEQ